MISDLEIGLSRSVSYIRESLSHSVNQPLVYPPTMSSSIWNHFSMNSSSRKATCNLCSSSFGFRRGSNLNLWRHLESSHSDSQFDVIDEKVANLVAVDTSALLYVDLPEFGALFPPHTRIPTRFHLIRNVMPTRVESLRENIRKRLTGRRVSLCIDQLTIKGGRTTLSCFNAAFINEEGELNNLLIPVLPLDGRPSSSSLRSQIDDIVEKYQMDVVAIVTDSSSTMRKAVKDMDKFNSRCAASQLHSAVKNAMEEWTHSSEMEEIKNFSHQLNHSSEMREQYFKFCADFGLQLVGVPEFEENRWNSPYHTLTMSLQQWKAIDTTLKFMGKAPLSGKSHLIRSRVVSLLQPFEKFTTKMCSSSFLLSEAAFVFSEITHLLRKFIEDGTDMTCPSFALAKLLLAQMEKRTVYYTESEETKKLLFFDPRAVQVFPYDWKSIGSSIMASVSPITRTHKYTWIEEKFKTEAANSIEEEIEKYLYDCNRGIDQRMNPLQFWKSVRSAYPNLAEMALKSLPIPATSVSAQRVLRAAGLLDKELHRSDTKIDESLLLLRFNSIGNLAREISSQPPLSLVPQSPTHDDNPSTTFGYTTDESDFEETVSDNEEEV